MGTASTGHWWVMGDEKRTRERCKASYGTHRARRAFLGSALLYKEGTASIQGTSGLAFGAERRRMKYELATCKCVCRTFGARTRMVLQYHHIPSLLTPVSVRFQLHERTIPPSGRQRGHRSLSSLSRLLGEPTHTPTPTPTPSLAPSSLALAGRVGPINQLRPPVLLSAT